MRRGSKGGVKDDATGRTTPRTVAVSEVIYKNIKQIEAVFRMMDVDGSGNLSREEFQEACAVLNKASPESQLSAEQIEELAENMDADHNGTISFNEFIEKMRHHKLT